MLILIYGAPQSGKKEVLEYLKTKDFVDVKFSVSMYSNIIIENKWTQNNVCLIPCLEKAKEVLERPSVRLLIIFAPTNSEWRNNIADDIFYQEILPFLSNSRYDISLLNNFSTLDDLKINIDKCLLGMRPSWDQYFMNIAFAISERSNCMKRKVGCVITKNNRVVSAGYNGTPTGMANCHDYGCKRCNSNARRNVDLHNCLCVHAEENALLSIDFSAAQHCTLYVTTFPCILCCRKIVQMQISRIVYWRNYDEESDNFVSKIFSNTGIELYKVTF
ncbi:hypothetical protein EDEG_01649 [Edhazardia aedis USNM 41457]|uniref:dCMP deaminase n=1 Tax=Edhazardia aedis (strain USNM 41457) TaxID=1003232 RepID=J8ZWP6_EDHAE|nr:hypothetical protein EDEG_01649 [Edhazardia aedis USNM 41457]|eukprot:EJW04073.1 hypothetical protein EDEG_01649 [Edhazardia aedis USNM 41457]